MGTDARKTATVSWLDPALWKRDGRGRRWEFELPSRTIIEALAGVSVRRDDQLELLACFRTGSAREWRSQYERRELNDLSIEGPWQYFVRSCSTTPCLPASEPLSGTGWPAVFAANGLIVLHHPDPARRSQPGLSSIGIVNRVRSEMTGDVIEHSAYDSLFHAVKNALRASTGPRSSVHRDV